MWFFTPLVDTTPEPAGYISPATKLKKLKNLETSAIMICGVRLVRAPLQDFSQQNHSCSAKNRREELHPVLLGEMLRNVYWFGCGFPEPSDDGGCSRLSPSDLYKAAISPSISWLVTSKRNATIPIEFDKLLCTINLFRSRTSPQRKCLIILE